MRRLIHDYRNFRMLADQSRWLALRNAIRAALGLTIIR